MPVLMKRDNDDDDVNPLHAKLFWGNKNILFMKFLHIDITQVVEIPPQVRQEPTYFE